MSEATTPAVDPLALEDADRAVLESNYYEWSDPLEINAAGAIEWEVPFGENWTFATIALETTQGTEYTVKIGPENEAALYQDGARKGDVVRLEPAGDEPASSDEIWHCGKCGYGPTSQRGVKIHDSRSHEGDPDVLSEAPETDALEEEASDDDADVDTDDAGVDVQEEDEDLVLVPVNKRSAAKVYHLRDSENPDQPKCGAPAKQWKPKPRSIVPGKRLCENCENGGRGGGPRERDGHTDAQTDTGPITVDAVDEPDDTEVELPEGVTEDDVLEAAAEHETLGDVGEAIGLTRGWARVITVELDCYGDVQDLPAGGR